ncbi:hypothetical protein BDK92_7170 [Micromonospora pisi]|uniref:Uncharacterized protein n=1 Tax=Micromonospora pisi TaxID=589240 RepID=A0A495JWG1_9ACTN|nr:hypothetical protein [Micromonospora pisi]RKR92692.1 hypothetical protein BDK92_7170 [Micromonospora pisi]
MSDAQLRRQSEYVRARARDARLAQMAEAQRQADERNAARAAAATTT